VYFAGRTAFSFVSSRPTFSENQCAIAALHLLAPSRSTDLDALARHTLGMAGRATIAAEIWRYRIPRGELVVDLFEQINFCCTAAIDAPSRRA
jgi:hypothetical protein